MRRGTINVAAGTVLPAGTGTIASVWPGVSALIRYDSGIARTCSIFPWYIVDSPDGEVGSGWICSWYMSVTSRKFVVTPQASWRFWPMITYGTPAKPWPVTSNPAPLSVIG